MGSLGFGFDAREIAGHRGLRSGYRCERSVAESLTAEGNFKESGSDQIQVNLIAHYLLFVGSSLRLYIVHKSFMPHIILYGSSIHTKILYSLKYKIFFDFFLYTLKHENANVKFRLF